MPQLRGLLNVTAGQVFERMSGFFGFLIIMAIVFESLSPNFHGIPVLHVADFTRKMCFLAIALLCFLALALAARSFRTDSFFILVVR